MNEWTGKDTKLAFAPAGLIEMTYVGGSKEA